MEIAISDFGCDMVYARIRYAPLNSLYTLIQMNIQWSWPARGTMDKN